MADFSCGSVPYLNWDVTKERLFLYWDITEERL